jgi:MFS family permease
MTARSPWIAVLLVSTTATAFSIMQGLTYPMLALLLEEAGASRTAIGANAAMTPIGMLAAAALAPRLVGRLGPFRTAVLSLIAAALSLALIGLTPPGVLWMPFRFVIGITIALIFVVTDTAVTSVAGRDMRGRALGIYATFISIGFGAGTLILATLGSGPAAFIAGTACILGAILPFTLVRRHLAHASEEKPGSVLGIVTVIPMLLLTVGVVALSDQAVLSLVPVYVLQHGFTAREAGFSVLAMVAGNLVLQYPLCWLADRLTRLAVSILCGVVATLAALSWPLVADHLIPFWIALFFWGGTFFTIYTLAIVRLGDRLSGAALVAGNAAFSALWGIGGALGPPLIGAAMDDFGTEALPLLSAALYAALTLCFLLQSDRPRSSPEAGRA